MNNPQGSRSLVVALPAGLCLAAVAWLLWTSLGNQPPANAATNATAAPRVTAAGADNRPVEPGVTGTPGQKNAGDDSKGGQASSNPGPSVAGQAKDEPANTPFTLDGFQRRFSELANAGDWDGLDKYIFRTLSKDAPALSELWPILLALLEGLGDRAGYDPVGRGVQTGLLVRRDLQDCATMLSTSFMETDSALVRVGLAGPLTQANKGKNNATLTAHIEKLLIHRDSVVKGAAPQNQSAYWDQLILGHTGLARSILVTIEFVESLRPGGLPDSKVRSFWSDCCRSAFYYRHYDAADVPAIVNYLIAHTDESLTAAMVSEASIKRLKRLWEDFREDQAYDSGLKHAQGLTDAKMQIAWDSILAHWLSKKKPD